MFNPDVSGATSQRARRVGLIGIGLLIGVSYPGIGFAEVRDVNERVIVHVLSQLVTSEKQYFSNHGGEYTNNIISENAHQGGLLDTDAARNSFLPAASELVRPPLGKRGERRIERPILYRGYYFRVLERQGTHAPGGAKPYIVNGRMTEGFAFLAFPGDYGTSGVHTFIVGDDDRVYQKDLGRNTVHLLEHATEFDPDPTWRRSDESDNAHVSVAAQKQWQVGTVTNVKVYQPRGEDPLTPSYEVSLKIGETVFVVLCTPRYDTGTAVLGTLREVNVLVGDTTITYNDLLGNPVQDPILQRFPAANPSF